MADLEKLQHDFDRVAALIEAPQKDKQAITDLMQPLLSGEMTLEAHELWLKQQLAELSAS